MSEEIEKTSDDKSEENESKSLDQDDISKLIDEMQSEENSSETEEQAEKTNDDEKKPESGEIKEDESVEPESNALNQDDISKLADEVQSEAKSSEGEETEDSTEHADKDNEGEKKAESEIPPDGNTQPEEGNDNTIKKKKVEEETGSQEPEEILGSEDQKEEKETDESDEKEDTEEDNGSFSGLDSDDENEIDGDPDPDTKSEIEKDQGDNEDKDDKSKEKDKDLDKRNIEGTDDGKATINKKAEKRFKGKGFKLLIACISSVVFVAVLLGIYLFFKKPGTNNKPEAATISGADTISAVDKIKVEKPYQAKQKAKQKNKYGAKLEEITNLRKELLIKEKEISDLIKNYKEGISEIENEILRVKQNYKIMSFSEAIKNKKIEFGMMTIKRRLEYIEKIDPPYKWLNYGIEELLYLKHKIEIDAQISSVISGIDMDKMIQEIDIVLRSYRTGIEKLEINGKNVELIPLEIIWKSIIDKEKFTAGNYEKTDRTVGINKPIHTNEENYNQMIWEEICNGDFKRKNEMTELSTQAAKCLSKWKHPDLFLNGISELPPEGAKYLLKWKGNWIGLNGVKELSPESAKHLFQWQGNWISLNGLSKISSGILNHLPQWQGKQLELMGLKYKGSKSEQAGLRSLAKWEKSGGKLYIPVKIRNVIKKF
jgi:chemotaxis protein histidine kinase CheA